MFENSLNQNMKNKNCEYVSKYILEPDFLKVYSTLNKIQVLIGSNRVDSRDLFISPLTFKHKIFTIIQIVVELVILVLTAYIYVKASPRSEELRYTLLMAGLIALVALNFLVLIIFARFRYNERNVQFQLQIQDIDRHMGLARNKPINDICRRVINMNLAVVCLLYAITYILIFCEGITNVAVYAAVTWCTMVMFCDTTHLSFLMMHFVVRVKFINSVILNHLEVPVKDIPRVVILPTRTWLRLTAAQTHCLNTMDIDLHLKMIFDCFYELQELYKLPIAALFISYFFYFWHSVQYTMFGLKHNDLLGIEWVLPPFLLSSAFAQTFILILRFEIFTREVRETKRLAIVLLSRYHEGPIWEKARRVHRLVAQVPPRFSVYGMWEMDAIFYLEFFKVLTTMIVTQLQFELS